MSQGGYAGAARGSDGQAGAKSGDIGPNRSFQKTVPNLHHPDIFDSLSYTYLRLTPQNNPQKVDLALFDGDFAYAEAVSKTLALFSLPPLLPGSEQKYPLRLASSRISFGSSSIRTEDPRSSAKSVKRLVLMALSVSPRSLHVSSMASTPRSRPISN
jgi:hypothetical protein